MPLDLEDPEVLRRQQEIAEDEEVIEHFRRQIKKADGRQKMTEVQELIETSLPAKSNMPVTTPRLSTSPKRPKSPEKIYQEKESIPDVGVVPHTPGRDCYMKKLYMQVSAAAEQEKGAVQVTQKPKSAQKKEDSHREDDSARQKEQPAEVAEKVDMGLPIQPGSTDANAIIADFIATKRASKFC